MPVLIARTAGIFAVTVGLFVGAAGAAAASDEEVGQRNPDQHMDFECEKCTHDTTVDHGYTYIYATCYGQSETGYEDWYAEGSSPDVDVHCEPWDYNHGYFQCISSAKDAHTVKVTMHKCTQ